MSSILFHTPIFFTSMYLRNYAATIGPSIVGYIEQLISVGMYSKYGGKNGIFPKLDRVVFC